MSTVVCHLLNSHSANKIYLFRQTITAPISSQIAEALIPTDKYPENDILPGQTAFADTASIPQYSAGNGISLEIGRAHV